MATVKKVPDSVPTKRGKEYWDQRQKNVELPTTETPDDEAPDDELLEPNEE